MEDAKIEIPAKFKEIVDSIEKMSVLDLNELVKLLEKILMIVLIKLMMMMFQIHIGLMKL